MRIAIGAFASLLCLTIGVATAQVWDEVDDAGDLPATAQTPVGEGVLTAINGTFISDAGNADMYKVEIPDPAAFYATTCGGTTSDTQLFLFDLDGIGVTHDDDDPAGCGLQSAITGTVCSFEPGCYYLAVSTYNNDPLGPNGDIWENSPFGEERCPDGPGAPGPVIAWDDLTSGSGPYTIFLDGVNYCAEATPTLETTWGQLKTRH